MARPWKDRQSEEERLEQVLATSTHRCSRCTTPYGRSSLPCPNDPASGARRLAALRARVATEFNLEQP